MPSLCGELIHGRWLPDPAVISIHPPRVGWDCSRYHSQCARWHFNPPTPCGVGPFQKFSARLPFHFNPPTPCGVGQEAETDGCSRTRFQSTHPVWGGTPVMYSAVRMEGISIHPPRVGWDRPCTSRHKRKTDFNPPTPCGVGQARTAQGLTANAFQSAHPVWGGTDSAINP